MKRFIVACLVVAAITGVLWFSQSHAGYTPSGNHVQGDLEVGGHIELGHDEFVVWPTPSGAIEDSYAVRLKGTTWGGGGPAVSGGGVLQVQIHDGTRWVSQVDWSLGVASPTNMVSSMYDPRKNKRRYIGNDPVTGSWRFDVGDAGWLYDFGSGRIGFGAHTNAAYPRAVLYPDGQLSLYDVQTNGYVYLDTDGGADNSILRLRSEGDRVEVWDSFWVTNGGKLMVGPSNVIEEIQNIAAGTGFATTQELLAVSGRVDTIEANTSNWNTAYSWGDHGTNGYAKTSVVDTQVWDEAQYPSAALSSVVNTQVWSESQYPSAALSSVVATQVWGDAQYPNALILDGSRAWIAYQNAGGYGVTNIGTNTLSFEDGTEVYSTLQAKAGAATSNHVYSLDNTMSAAEIQAIIDAAPRISVVDNIYVRFQFADGTYNLNDTLVFEGFVIELQIYGNSANNSKSTTKNVHLNFTSGTYGLSLRQCAGPDIRYLKITHQSGPVIFYRCTHALMYWNYILQNASNSFMVYNNGSSLYIRGTYLTSSANCDAGIDTARGGFIYSHDNSTTGGNPRYGLRCAGGKIAKESSQPTGNTANENTSYGGQIL